MTYAERIAELKDFERTEHCPLPYFPADILALEDRGYVVDLCSGEVTRPDSFTPTPSAQAILHLLEHMTETIAL